MKKWIMGATALCTLTLAVPSAWAGDGLHQRDGAITSHDVSTVAPDAPHLVDEPSAMHHWEVKSSVQVTRQDLRDAYLAARHAYTQKLQKYAKCTPTEAKKAVTAAHPGMKVDDVELRNIRTNLVYVGVAEDEEDRYVVIVDAGNGKVILDRPVPTHHERVFAEH